jgi:hypothetical protein
MTMDLGAFVEVEACRCLIRWSQIVYRLEGGLVGDCTVMGREQLSLIVMSTVDVSCDHMRDWKGMTKREVLVVGRLKDEGWRSEVWRG